MQKNIKRRLREHGAWLPFALPLALGMVPIAQGQSQELAAPAPAGARDQVSTESTDIRNRANLFGDMGGLRSWLGNRGATLGLQETSETLRNFSGGTRRGGAYDGQTQLTIGVDTEKAFGLPGGTFNVSALQIHGASLSARNLQVLQSASGEEARAGTRLWELWYQQAMLDGKFDVKVGKQSLDQEFMVSQYAATFMNATFGWPVLPSADLPAGGPAYPFASLGMRLRAKPADGITVLGGVFDGNPAHGSGDPQQLNAHGTRFTMHDGALFIGEVQYAISQPAADASSAPSQGLPGTYKLGFWYNTNRFADPYYDNTGLSLANPASTGTAATHRGDYSLYAVADQMVWRSSEDSARAVGVFARVMGAPGDRNPVAFGLNAGVTLTSPFKGRDHDVAGLAVGYAHIGSRAQSLASSQAFYTPGYPSRSAETVVEATYQYQVTPWWQLQADLQYVFRPSGGIPDPVNPSQRIGNEAVVGLRTVITF
ncbi:MAG: carbohydrate porin [Bordetella sp.]|uniref:carbohydrate porin n=1 Tax=Bordetella sp. TaxID=28081 RepID=UPI003F7CACCC